MSCKHSAQEVLDFSKRSELEAKINQQCQDECQRAKKELETTIDDVIQKADAIFSQEEEIVSEEIDRFDQMAGAFDSISEIEVDDGGDMDDIELTNDLNENFQKQLLNSNIDDDDKEDLKKAADQASKSKPKTFKNAIKAQIFALRAKTISKDRSISSRKNAFKAKIGKVKDGLKSVGSMDNVAKATVALAGGARGLSKFMAARNPDGSIDPKQVVGGVIDVVDGIAAFLPAPASVITGTCPSHFEIYPKTFN